MNNKKVQGLISICKKAGYLIVGGDNLKGYTQKLYLVLYEKNSGKNLIKIANSLKSPNTDIYELENLFDYTNIEGCKIVGIKNKGLADQIQKLLKE